MRVEVKPGWFGGVFKSLVAVALLLAPKAAAQERVLPPPPILPQDDFAAISDVYVRDFAFVGNTRFSDAELSAVIRSYAQRRVTSGELEQARQALTIFYIERGFINSGAVLNDQPLTNGVVTFTVVEGRLSEIAVSGQGRLRTGLLQSRLRLHAGPPLNINSLQEALLQLKNNPNVQRLNAELMPGGHPGEARLEVKVREANPWHLAIEVRNDRPPSVGAETAEIIASHSNVSGRSDELTLRYGIAHRTRESAEMSGLDDWGITYTLPITPRETMLRVYYDRNDFTVIEEPFAELGINSKSQTYGLMARHPLLKSLRTEFALGLIAERRESETFVLGEGFSFRPGAADPRTEETVLRFFQEWVQRRQSQVIALRSTISWGVDAFATEGAEPNGTFFAWLAQCQYVRRLGGGQNQLIWNTTFQWASEPLLSLEQFSLGGANTVRGYRENQLIRDMGVLTSVELRFPIVTSGIGASILEVAPFVDFGAGWNARGPTPQPSDLASCGLGLIYTPHRRVNARLYWGHGFRDFRQGSSDLQDYGLHFRLNFSLL